MQKLILEAVSGAGFARIAEFDGGSITLGREPENRIVIHSGAVSRRHACIFTAGNQWCYSDLGSANGSWLNSIQIRAGEPRILRNGDLLILADLFLHVVLEGAVTEIPSVLVFFGEKFDSEFSFGPAAQVFNVGGITSELPVHSEGEVLSVVRKHGLLELNVAGSLPVSLNGVAVQGQTTLNDRDVLRADRYQFLVSQPSAADPMDLRERFPTIFENNGPVKIECESREMLPGTPGRADEGEWASESVRRKTQSPRRFVFEQEEGTDFVAQRTALHLERVGEQTQVYEGTPAQRFSSISKDDNVGNSELTEKIFAVLGFLVFIGFIAGLIYLLMFEGLK